MFCSECGNEIDYDMAFCPRCGAPVGGEELYEDETDYTADDTDEVNENKKSSLLRDNKGGAVVAIFVSMGIIFDSIGNSNPVLPGIIGSPFSLFTGSLGWAIAKNLKRHLAPDVIYYRSTFSLISTKLWWGGGIHILCSAIGSVIPAGIISLILGI